MEWKDLTPTEANAEIKANVQLLIIDLRSRDEFLRGHISGSINVPFMGFRTQLKEFNPNCSYLIVSRCGTYSKKICKVLSDLGFGDLRNLQGGVIHWTNTGFPL